MLAACRQSAEKGHPDETRPGGLFGCCQLSRAFRCSPPSAARSSGDSREMVP